MTRELHQAHQGPYAAPGGLLAGAHTQLLGEPQIYRQQEAQCDGDDGLTEADGQIFRLDAGGDVGTDGAPAPGMEFGRGSASKRDPAATVASGGR